MTQKKREKIVNRHRILIKVRIQTKVGDQRGQRVIKYQTRQKKIQKRNIKANFENG